MRTKNFITSPELVIGYKPLEELKPRRGILSQCFGRGQKYKAPDALLSEAFPLLWRSVPQELAYCIASHTAVWTETIHPAQVIEVKRQRQGEYKRYYFHYDAGQLVWTTSFRWQLQDNGVYLAVSFQGLPAMIENILNDLAFFAPEIDEHLAPTACVAIL
ncbi:hypothetical protein EQP59_04470 [Ornithobacterium rhinotracheale]|uniref:Uncharacterized protein n=1 Tax=Ornithobacterium rhinotracheale TaxID=28251 RepID=A0A3R5UVF3_ORNRH|nr:hypothetical protein [Ornithobacterium rhinotracheale]QAR30652.1 hypothetical protein EQP59_04470 [Ornithobacterium rhinotracheale]